MGRPDGPAFIAPAPARYVRAVCPVCEWVGPDRNAENPDEAALVRRDVNVHNEQDHDEWPPRS